MTTRNQMAFLTWLEQNATIAAILQDETSGRWYPVTLGEVSPPTTVNSNLVSTARDQQDLVNFLTATLNGARVSYDPVDKVYRPDVLAPVSHMPFTATGGAYGPTWWAETLVDKGFSGLSATSYGSMITAIVDTFGLESVSEWSTTSNFAGFPPVYSQYLNVTVTLLSGSFGLSADMSFGVTGFSNGGHVGNRILALHTAGNAFGNGMGAESYYTGADTALSPTLTGGVADIENVSMTLTAGQSVWSMLGGAFANLLTEMNGSTIPGTVFYGSANRAVAHQKRGIPTNLYVHGFIANPSSNPVWALLPVTSGALSNGIGLGTMPQPALVVTGAGQWDIPIAGCAAALEQFAADPSTVSSIPAATATDVTNAVKSLKGMQGFLRFQQLATPYTPGDVSSMLGYSKGAIPGSAVLVDSTPPVTVADFNTAHEGKPTSQFTGWLVGNTADGRAVLFATGTSTTTSNGGTQVTFTYLNTATNAAANAIDNAVYWVNSAYVSALKQQLNAAGFTNVDVNPAIPAAVDNPLFDGTGERFIALKAADDSSAIQLAVQTLAAEAQVEAKFRL